MLLCLLLLMLFFFSPKLIHIQRHRLEIQWESQNTSAKVIRSNRERMTCFLFLFSSFVGFGTVQFELLVTQFSHTHTGLLEYLLPFVAFRSCRNRKSSEIKFTFYSMRCESDLEHVVYWLLNRKYCSLLLSCLYAVHFKA